MIDASWRSLAATVVLLFAAGCARTEPGVPIAPDPAGGDPTMVDAQSHPSLGAVPAMKSPLEVPLWPAPGLPSMSVVFPKRRGSKPAPALVVFQGGGYSTPFGSGAGSAEWAADHGMVGVRVEYGTRSSGRFYPASYADAARAVRLVKHRATEWGVDVERVGVMGFSAGGHLASLLS